MLHLRYLIPPKQYGDNIKLQRRILRMIQKKNFSGLPEVLTLVSFHRRLGKPKLGGRSRLYFHKSQIALRVKHDEINLAMTTAPIAVENGVSLGNKVVGGDGFTAAPEEVLIGHKNRVFWVQTN